MQFSFKKAAKDTAAAPAKEARLGGMGRGVGCMPGRDWQG